MSREIVLIFAKRLRDDNFICFRLYNALYRIVLYDDYLSIQQEGIDISYRFSDLRDLFLHYIVYGNPLVNCINDIKII